MTVGPKRLIRPISSIDRYILIYSMIDTLYRRKRTTILLVSTEQVPEYFQEIEFVRRISGRFTV